MHLITHDYGISGIRAHANSHSSCSPFDNTLALSIVLITNPFKHSKSSRPKKICNQGNIKEYY